MSFGFIDCRFWVLYSKNLKFLLNNLILKRIFFTKKLKNVIIGGFGFLCA
ncbi:hypothetical protein RCH33_3114 [Flavobacterium daejeonense]|nr:hypothetical protein RCH33_3114 [Flavobacterium daejeonense]